MTYSVTESLKCYENLDDETPKAMVCEEPDEQNEPSSNACAKMVVNDGKVEQFCFIAGAEGCASVELKNGTGTFCACMTDLCNTGSNTRTAKTLHFLMVTLAINVATRCMKLTFIWVENSHWMETMETKTSASAKSVACLLTSIKHHWYLINIHNDNFLFY